MTTINKLLFSQPPIAAPAEPYVSQSNLFNGETYPHPNEHADEELLNVGLPVPLYVIAAAALLG